MIKDNLEDKLKKAIIKRSFTEKEIEVMRLNYEHALLIGALIGYIVSQDEILGGMK